MNEQPEIGTTRLEPGWHKGLSMRTYLDDPAVSASRLWKLHEETPAHLEHELRERPDDSSKAKELGSITHSAVYEPDLLAERYVVIGQCEGRFLNGKDCTYQGSFWRDGQSFCKRHDPYDGAPMAEGVYTVAGDQLQTAKAVKVALLAHPTAAAIIGAPGPKEVTGIWQDEKTGLWCRIRPDQLIHDPPETPDVFHHSLVNLKTTGKSAAPHRFPRDAERLGHYFKAAFYGMGAEALGFNPRHFLYPVAESVPPYEVIVYRLDEDALDIGAAEVRQALDDLARCRKTGKWPGYGPEVHNLNLSAWRLKQVHDIDFLELAS